MQKTPLWMSLWPGLTRLWFAGQWSGLLAAVAFAGLLNFVLAATFLWPIWQSTGWLAVFWIVVGVWWLASLRRAFYQRKIPAARTFGAAEVDLFIQAQTEYLKGSWFEAEARLKELLARNDLDVDAQILLAGLYRHTGRIAEAHQCLRRLERIDGAEKWRLEIEDERVRLERKTTAAEVDESPPVSEAA